MDEDIRIKDLPLAEEGIQSGDYLPVDGATDGTRKITMQDIAEANIDGLETEASNTKGAINELFNKASRTVSLTQAEYDALPDSKLSDDIAYFITDGEPDVDNALWTKVGRATLDTQAQNCSEAINEIKQSLSDLESHEYIVTRWITFSYFNASQLEGTYTMPTVPSGYSVRLLGCMPTFANNSMGAKFSGKFLSSTGNKMRALGTGFVSGDSETFLVLFLVYKS